MPIVLGPVGWNPAGPAPGGAAPVMWPAAGLAGMLGCGDWLGCGDMLGCGDILGWGDMLGCGDMLGWGDMLGCGNMFGCGDWPGPGEGCGLVVGSMGEVMPGARWPPVGRYLYIISLRSGLLFLLSWPFYHKGKKNTNSSIVPEVLSEKSYQSYIFSKLTI